MVALDGTSNKARLGANAILGASLGVAKAAAAESAAFKENVIERCAKEPAGAEFKYNRVLIRCKGGRDWEYR